MHKHAPFGIQNDLNDGSLRAHAELLNMPDEDILERTTSRK